MRLTQSEGENTDAIVAYPVVEKAIMQDRLEQAQRLARRHIQLQARQLAAELEVELRCRAKAAETEAQECVKQGRLNRREDISNDEKDRRLKERHDHEDRALARANYLEWATAAERLHQQDCIAQRRFEAGLVRAEESDRKAAARRAQQAKMDQQLRAHEAKVLRHRNQKAAQYDAKLGRITAMENRRDEMLDKLSRLRQNAYSEYDTLKELYYESAVQNDDDMLRRLLEELVPRLTSIPHTPRSKVMSPQTYRASSAGPSPKSMDSSPRRSLRARSAHDSRARSLENPARLAGIGGASRRQLSAGPASPNRKLPSDKPSYSDSFHSRSTSAASLGTSGLFSASGGSESWTSIPSPAAAQVSSAVQLLASLRNNQLPIDDADASPRIPTAPIDCPLCYTTPRRSPQRGIPVDIAAYAKNARGMA